MRLMRSDEKDEPTKLDPGGASRLFDLTRGVKSISERTWRDLSMNAVFARIDHCFTAAGRQLLYRRLRNPSTTPTEIEAFDQRVEAFTKHPALRDRLKKATRPLDVGLADALYGSPVTVSKRIPLFVRLGSMSAMIAAALSFVWPYAILVLALCILANVALRLSLHGTMSLHTAAFGSVADLITSASAVTKIEPLHQAPQVIHADLSSGRAALEAIHAVLPSLRWLTLDVLKVNELTGILITYLNVVFLLDVRAFLKTTRIVNKHRPALQRIFEMVGTLDAAQAVATFRASHGGTSKPRFLPPGSALHIEGLTHPLLAPESAQANDIALGKDGHRGWLIMGSNMSGKSTFLRAVALQAILAQTIACVTATHYEAPITIVRTLMHVEDDLLSGRSHFLVEAETSRAILEDASAATNATTPGRAPGAAEEHPTVCVVVDELFRGTNTADRVAAGSAFLRALEKRGAFVVAAAHDSELIALLQAQFAPHYFQETIENGELTFDYVLHEGAVAPRNAIAVLELVGYPTDVLDEMRHLANTTDRSSPLRAEAPPTPRT